MSGLCMLAALTIDLHSQTLPLLTKLEGSWAFNFTGGLSGSGSMTITPDGRMEVHVSLGKYERFFSNPVKLTVSRDGLITGSILLWRLPVGSVDGSLAATGEVSGRVSTPLFRVGTVSGQFSPQSGEGTYESVAGNGSWSAHKI